MNPFRAKAEQAQQRATRLTAPTSHERGMAESFPLGAGFGRPGASRRIDASVSRAVESVQAQRRAAMLLALADAFDRGEVNAQGRAINAASVARSDKRYTATLKRTARITAAKEAIEGKDRRDVSPEQWADAQGYLAGSARALVMQDQKDYCQSVAA